MNFARSAQFAKILANGALQQREKLTPLVQKMDAASGSNSLKWVSTPHETCNRKVTEV